MRKMHVFGFAMLAVFAFGVSVASSAFAVELVQWLVNGATIGLTTSINVVALPEGNLLLLEDTSQGIGVECLPSETSLAFATTNGGGEQLVAGCSEVTVENGTCGSPKVEGVDLPWTTALSEPAAGEFEGLIKGTGEGAGWLVECTILGVKVDDTCTTNNGKVLFHNESDGLIDVEFMPPAKTEEANCSIGPKKEVGLVEGLTFLHALTTAGELEIFAISKAPEVTS